MSSNTTPSTSAASATAGSYLVGLVGTGIGPSLTPPLHEREADRLGLRYLYRRLDLDALRLPRGRWATCWPPPGSPASPG